MISVDPSLVVNGKVLMDLLYFSVCFYEQESVLGAFHLRGVESKGVLCVRKICHVIDAVYMEGHKNNEKKSWLLVSINERSN